MSSTPAAPTPEPAIAPVDASVDAPVDRALSAPGTIVGEPAAFGLAALSAAMYFLGFTGFDIWPLALVSMVPLLVALRGRSGWRALRLGWLMGTIANAGGFHWVVGMLKTFSGFPTPLCFSFSLLLDAAQGLEFAVFAWLIARADGRGFSRWLTVPATLAALELAFPLLFPTYTANSLQTVLVLVQTADLGGPIFVSVLVAFGWVAIERAVIPSRGVPLARRLRPLLVPLAIWAVAIPYGIVRMHQVDRESATAPALRVGLVQENLGLTEKRDEPANALVRHLAATRRLEARGVDLVVWSESAVSFVIPEYVTDIHDAFPPWNLHVPVLFGALGERGQRLYNTAVMVDGSGHIEGTYDKTYLLAFGEYLPGGETFPKFYEWSPHTGHFTPGSRLASVPLPGSTPSAPRSVIPLICYEDILPRFVRDFERATDASLLAVILNDAWFGQTSEPWSHLALATFRSIEQRRDFVRAANSGVSAFIDAAGRVTGHTGTFSIEAPIGVVHLRRGHTLYYYLGDWIAWLGVIASVGVFVMRLRGGEGGLNRSA
jgi:apolipoprotein N-acyltransferase